jgi:hypothetical protein
MSLAHKKSNGYRTSPGKSGERPGAILGTPCQGKRNVAF